MGGRTAQRRLALAIITTVVVAAFAYLVIGIGLNLYLDDYCPNAMDMPDGARDWKSISGQLFANPVTIECHFDNVGWVSQTDPLPLVVASGVVLLGAGVAAPLWRSWLSAKHQEAATTVDGR